MNPLTRRRFLAGSAATTALLGGAAALALKGGGRAHADILARLGPYEPVVLSKGALAVLAAVVERMVGAAPPMPSTYELRVACRVDKELSFHGARVRDDVAAALLLVEHGGLLHGSLARFTTLSPDEQDARLEAMRHGVQVERMVFQALRTMAVFFTYVDDRTWPHVRYDGPLIQVRTPPAADSRGA